MHSLLPTRLWLVLPLVINLLLCCHTLVSYPPPLALTQAVIDYPSSHSFPGPSISYTSQRKVAAFISYHSQPPVFRSSLDPTRLRILNPVVTTVVYFVELRFICLISITAMAINIFLGSKKYKLLTDVGPLPVPVLLRLWLHSDLQPLSPRSNPQCVHWSTARGCVYFVVKIVLLQFED
jgi:hypothetical protein